MEYPRGTIVKGPDVIGPHSARPWLVVSDESHPFSDEECLVAAVTTTARDRAIELGPERFASGSLPRQSYVSPWVVTTLKTAEIQAEMATITPETVTAVAEDIAGYVGIELEI
jgi:mRNA-degrading endonuclease toxin of MazEF toxin-antitoxin module